MGWYGEVEYNLGVVWANYLCWGDVGIGMRETSFDCSC